MTAEIINLADRREVHHPGNGGHEAMAVALAAIWPLGDCFTDDVLANLWLQGFKVVPLGDEE